MNFFSLTQPSQSPYQIWSHFNGFDSNNSVIFLSYQILAVSASVYSSVFLPFHRLSTPCVRSACEAADGFFLQCFLLVSFCQCRFSTTFSLLGVTLQQIETSEWSWMIMPKTIFILFCRRSTGDYDHWAVQSVELQSKIVMLLAMIKLQLYHWSQGPSIVCVPLCVQGCVYVIV